MTLVGAHFEPKKWWEGPVRIVVEDDGGDVVRTTRKDGRYPRTIKRARLLSSAYRAKRGVPTPAPDGGWQKYPSVAEPPHNGCRHCPPKPIVMPLDANPHPGFGMVTLYRDGEYVKSAGEREDGYHSDELVDSFTVQQFEDIAAQDPDHDWQMWVNGPMSDATYQRHSASEWVCIEKGFGFA